MSVYDIIAKEFSKTRYRVWKGVKDFLDSSSGINVIEAGCGNGKNLFYASDIGKTVSGFDACQEFVDICQNRGLNVWKGDILTWIPTQQYDLVLSIAVIHHLQSNQERLQALDNLYKACKSGGRIFITVWSYETEWEGVKSRIQKQFQIGDNQVDWRHKATRYYYVYNFSLLTEFIKEFQELHPETLIQIQWEEQNWNILIYK